MNRSIESGDLVKLTGAHWHTSWRNQIALIIRRYGQEDLRYRRKRWLAVCNGEEIVIERDEVTLVSKAK